MIVFRFILFVFFFMAYGVDVFLFSLSVYFLYELFVGFGLGFWSNIFFCGSWGYVLCLLRVMIVMLMYWRGGILGSYVRGYLLLLWMIFVGLIFCFKSNNFFLFYLRFEFIVVPIFLMILLFGYRLDRVLASLYMFLYTLLTSLPFLMFLLYNEVVFYSMSLLYDELVNKLEFLYGWWVFL